MERLRRDHLGGPNVTTGGLIRKTGNKDGNKSQSKAIAEKDPRAQECKWPLKTGKVKEWEFSP